MADFYVDHDVSRLLAVQLRAEGHTAITAREGGKEGAGDDEQVLLATELRRILVTHNARDYKLLHCAWRHWTAAWNIERFHSGILILPHGAPSANARLLGGFLALGLPTTNQIYEWRRSRGWHRPPDTP